MKTIQSLPEKITAPLRLLLVDDHNIVLTGLATVLEFDHRIEVVAMAENGADAVVAYRTHQPDLVLMDIRMAGMDGIETLRQLRNEYSSCRVIMLTTSETPTDLRDALAAGAVGYLLKTTNRTALLDAIFTVHAGGQAIPTALLRQIKEANAAPLLTQRQLEVLDLLSKGLSNKEIAAVLGFSEAGTKKHLISIFEKLGAADRTDAVIIAIQSGLVKMDL